MSLFANATAKAASGNVKEAFKNEEGAIDLASIMVGIIVIGLIGGVIAATVFAVIPWAQDNAAEQQLDSLAAAQSAYVGLSLEATTSPNGVTADLGKAQYGNATNLSAAKLFDATSAKVKVAVTGAGDTAHYIAAKKSQSGKVFVITDTKTQPTEATGATLTQANAASIAGGTVINSVTWGVGGATPTNISWTGTF
jgi:type II secretory pathway pseudopilin PulG